MLSKKLVLEILNAALVTGGDFAEIYYEDSYVKYLQMENGKVHDAVVNANINGVGIRVLKGLRSVYGHTNDISKKSLMKLASDLAKSFEGKQECFVKDLKLQRAKKVNKPIEPYLEVKDEEITSLIGSCYKEIAAVDPRIVRIITAFLINVENVCIYNSQGKMFKDHRERGRLILNAVAFENGKIETNYTAPGTRKGFSFFTKELDALKLAKTTGEKAIMMLSAQECPSGRFPVIIGSGWGGVIFHEACGHQLEATSVSKNLSVFSNMVGQQIGSSIVTAYDNGTMPNEWGSNNMDDEGQPTHNNLLIDKGVLKGYLVDPFGSRRMPGFAPNGCSRRQSYKFEPTSRMSNTYIANGKSTKEEIIAATKLAIYAVSFGGGSVNPATGEFNFGCSEAYLVKDGKICQPLRGATLIGKASEILKHIDMVGNDLDLGQGMCGSYSGSIPTNVGQPTIRIDEITVGGRGGSIDEL